MGMSVRSLQMKLNARGVVFTKLVKKIREQLAIQYLAEAFTIDEISCFLGFSDTASFRKSFKKWTGKTPNYYRRTLICT